MKFLKISIIILIAVLISGSADADDFEKLMEQAEELYEEGKYEESAELSEKAFKVGEPTAMHHYNAACSWALSGNKEKAIDNLNKAVESGFLNLEWMKEDPDLKSLHGSEEWKTVIARQEEAMKEIENSFPDNHNPSETIDLPDPSYASDTSIEEALLERRSVRSYKDEPLTLHEISQLLWAAYGITKQVPGGPDFLRGGFRTAPSAGALYPLEIYVVAGNVTDLSPGIYRYDSRNHKLEKTMEGDKRKELAGAALGQSMIKEAPAVIVYSAVFERTTRKYGDRGRERYVWMDAGHSAQNIYLQGISMDIGLCVSGAFRDLNVKKVMNMTREEEPVYIIPVGKK